MLCFWDKTSMKPRQIQNKDFFRNHYVFGTKIYKIEQIQSCKFSLSLFDQVSY